MNFPSKDLVGDELHEQAPTLPLIRLGGGVGFGFDRYIRRSNCSRVGKPVTRLVIFPCRKAGEKSFSCRVTASGMDMKTITKYCKEHRRNPTKAEQQLKRWLLKAKLGTNFRTQRPFDRYIVDFLFPLKRIALEVDGGYHNTPQQQAKDRQRTNYLEQKGLTVIRITNEQVMAGDLGWIKDRIESAPDVDVPWREAYGQAAY